MADKEKSAKAEQKEPQMDPRMEAALRDAYAHAEDISRDEQRGTPAPAEAASADQAKADAEVAGAEEKAAPTVDAGELTALQAALKSAETKAEEAKSSMLRARADLENARRRFEREQKESKKYAAEKVLKALIPVVDDLDRALEHGGEEGGALADGVKLVHRKFLQALEGEGAKSFSPQGEAFDPMAHEAMTQMPSAEVPAGHVLQVFQRGWYLQERLLRPAKVIVASAPE